ncbi:putative prophage protein [Escherichia coli]|uniref:Putative prophage protein n=1 Tax=Escherichia coli TaxID=562 RepID=A0A447XVL2_ECOLX|nr:putative prophage protein [Escherichia coli]
MRKFKIIIETGIAGGDFEDEFEVDDDAKHQMNTG